MIPVSVQGTERWVAFFYSPTGDAGSVKDFLGEDLARTVQCDGTSITNFIERAGGKRPGCWAHGRRRLVIEATNNRRERELDVGGERTAAILTIVATCRRAG